MSKIYDIAFRMGVLFNILLFTILNIISYTVAENRHFEFTRKYAFGSDYGFAWGFPFKWSEKYFNVVEGAGTVLNVLIYVACGFFFGFLFKFIWSKISRHWAELK
jgi:hypothetical protein